MYTWWGRNGIHEKCRVQAKPLLPCTLHHFIISGRIWKGAGCSKCESEKVQVQWDRFYSQRDCFYSLHPAPFHISRKVQAKGWVQCGEAFLVLVTAPCTFPLLWRESWKVQVQKFLWRFYWFYPLHPALFFIVKRFFERCRRRKVQGIKTLPAHQASDMCLFVSWYFFKIHDFNWYCCGQTLLPLWWTCFMWDITPILCVQHFWTLSQVKNIIGYYTCNGPECHYRAIALNFAIVIIVEGK